MLDEIILADKDKTFVKFNQHAKQTLISLNQEERYGKTVEDVPLSLKRVLSNKTNLIFTS